MGLHRWHRGKESACQCRGRGFDPSSRKIPHISEQLKPGVTFALTIRFFDTAQQTEMAIKNTRVANIYVPNVHTLVNVRKAETK